MRKQDYVEVWDFPGGRLTLSNPEVTFLDTLRAGSENFPERTRDDVYALYYDVKLELGGNVVFEVRECESMWVFNVAEIVRRVVNMSREDSFLQEVEGSGVRIYYSTSDLNDYLGYMYGWYMFKVDRFIQETLEDDESADSYVYSEGYEFLKERYTLTFGAPTGDLYGNGADVEVMKMCGIGGLRRDDMERLCEVAERFSDSALKVGMAEEREYVKELENGEG